MPNKKNPYAGLALEPINLFDRWSAAQIKQAYAWSDQYRTFLSTAKTERETVTAGVQALRAAGFIAWEEWLAGPVQTGKRLKVYATYEHKNLLAIETPYHPQSYAFNMLMAHVDSPRLDLKSCPLYEDHELAFFKTQYYGGIKKYQWVTIPLAIHGVMVLRNGQKISVCLGEDPADPVLCITDILPHVNKFQRERKGEEVIMGEEMNLLIGTRPVPDKDVKERVKMYLLAHLNKRYGITEADFQSADLEIVPAGPARDLGVDASMLLGYGHDDRACAYAALQAFLAAETVHPTLLFWVDKEEIGSIGVSGAQSEFLDYILEQLSARLQWPVSLRKILFSSAAISADVNMLLDPTFAQVVDLANTAQINRGIVVNKYNGGRGKSQGLEVDAEYLGLIRQLWDRYQVGWQMGTLGKVDEGGGGTIAEYLAHRGISVIDAGVGILAMHSPNEVVSKLDLYATYQAYKVFLEHFINHHS